MNTHVHGIRRRRSLWKSPALVTALSLSILLLAARFVDGWNWRPGAFIVVSALIFAIGFIYECVTRNTDVIAFRAAVAIAFAAGFMLMWGNLVQAADVTPFAAIYVGVPIVGLIGTAVARLRPNGMARALLLTALAQAVVLVGAVTFLITRNPELSTWTPPEWRGFVGNAVVAMLFGGSALLFRKAGRGERTHTCPV